MNSNRDRGVDPVGVARSTTPFWRLPVIRTNGCTMRTTANKKPYWRTEEA